MKAAKHAITTTEQQGKILKIEAFSLDKEHSTLTSRIIIDAAKTPIVKVKICVGISSHGIIAVKQQQATLVANPIMNTIATLLKAGCDVFLGRRVTKSFSNALGCITSNIPDIATSSTQYMLRQSLLALKLLTCLTDYARTVLQNSLCFLGLMQATTSTPS